MTAAENNELKAEALASEERCEAATEKAAEAEKRLRASEAALEEARTAGARTSEEQDKLVSDLRLEVSELEMKNSSLEGSLSSVSKENAELASKILSVEQAHNECIIKLKGRGKQQPFAAV